MRDYTYLDETGQRVPVARMPTEKIAELLRDGFAIDEDDGEADAEGCVRERLRLELDIRRWGLR
jgi:hypothetical protein